jgi:hypothetical protein
MINQLLVGAHLKVYVNGGPFGRTADFSWEESTPRRETAVVDYLPPWELEQGSVSVRASMTIYRMHMDGGIENAGLKAVWADLPREKYFSLLLIDRVTDTVVFRADRCSVEHQSWRATRGYVMGSVSIKALDWSNETQASSG